MATPPKKTRKVKSLAERKATLEEAKKRLAADEAKIAVAELKEFLAAFKPTTIASLFDELKAQKASVKRIDVLRTIAEIGKVKVTITEKPIAARANKGKGKAAGSVKKAGAKSKTPAKK